MSDHGSRVGLVLGAGGVLGAAWMTGALPAIAGRIGRPLGEVDFILGTSAGSVLAAALRCGVSIEEMVAYQRGEPGGPLAGLADVAGGPWPRPPRLRFGSPRLMASALRAPHRIHPTVSACAWLPVGRESHAALHAMVLLLHARHAATRAGTAAAVAGHTAAASPEHAVLDNAVLDNAVLDNAVLDNTVVANKGPDSTGSGHWAQRGQTWIVAVDYDSGSRVVFGSPGAPPVRLADAVVASCSVPGWYEPVVVGGRRYIDGGVRSATSLDLLAGENIGEVYVLAPLASVVADRRYAPHLRLERRVRSLFTYALLREVRALRSAGVTVTVLTPGPEDLAVMGINLMDPRRRQAVLETALRTAPAALADPERPLAA